MALRNPVYMDTSALVKLVVPEPESQALAQHLGEVDLQMATSEITEVELIRAVSRIAESLAETAYSLLASVVLLPLTTSIRSRAAQIRPSQVRSLDAIHLATAVEIQADLDSLVSYDRNMVEAATGLGLEALSPA